jgi:hypothetical protein
MSASPGEAYGGVMRCGIVVIREEWGSPRVRRTQYKTLVAYNRCTHRDSNCRRSCGRLRAVCFIMEGGVCRRTARGMALLLTSAATISPDTSAAMARRWSADRSFGLI